LFNPTAALARAAEQQRHDGESVTKMKVRNRTIYTATQWLKMGDHKAVKRIPQKLMGYIPVIKGAKGYVIQEFESRGYFVFPGDWVVESEEGYISIWRDEDFKKKFIEAT
jgi:hypothetical protein